MNTSKKIISVILSLVFILSAFSINAFAASTKTEALISKVKDTKEVSVKFTAGNTILGSSTDTVSIKGDTIAYDYSSGFLNARVVYKNGTAYGYLPILPFFYVKLDNLGFKFTNTWEFIEKAAGITFAVLDYQKSYNETINGVEYYVEEYNDRAQVTTKFCFIGEDLKLINVYDARTLSTQNTYIENISFSVADNAVAVPTGFDLTPLLKTAFAGLIASIIGL